MATPVFRFVQLPASVNRNEALQERCLDEAKRLNAGIAFSIGFTDASGIAAQARFPTWKYYEQVIEGALRRDIPKIRIKLGGGPPVHRTWTDLSDTPPWGEPNRPPRGPGNRLWAKVASYKQHVIDQARLLILQSGRQPKDILEIQLATEPGKGGSGGPWLGVSPNIVMSIAPYFPLAPPIPHRNAAYQLSAWTPGWYLSVI